MTHKKTFPAAIQSLYEMLDFIEVFCKETKLCSKTLEHIHLACEEALVNIISYGYPEGKRGEIEIGCHFCPLKERLEIAIKDRGVPFNPIEKLPKELPKKEQILSQHSAVVGGYGIYIFVGLMDKVEYERLEDGNKLTLVKCIPRV